MLMCSVTGIMKRESNVDSYDKEERLYILITAVFESITKMSHDSFLIFTFFPGAFETNL